MASAKRSTLSIGLGIPIQQSTCKFVNLKKCDFVLHTFSFYSQNRLLVLGPGLKLTTNQSRSAALFNFYIKLLVSRVGICQYLVQTIFLLKNLPGADTFRPNRKTKPNKNMFSVAVCSDEIGDQFNSATTLVNTIKTLVKTIKTLVKRINVFKSEKPSNICRSDLLHNFSWCNLATLKNEVSGSSTSLILSGSPSIKSFQCFTKLRRTTTITCPCNLKLIIYGNQAPN